MDSLFKELGDAILRRWTREKFALEKFPQLAAKALDKNPPAQRVDLPALMRDFLLEGGHPPQTDSPFGEPEIIVYHHPRFYIQLLFWMDGTTAIHQHSFSGAFHVMHGSSIHAHYAFEKAKPVTPHLSVGNVRMTGIEILETGRTVPIISGNATIHSLFHLDSPSVTVVVRTQHDAGSGPQFNYLPPHVAIDPLHSDLLTMRRTQLLDVLGHTESPGYTAVVLEMLADLDFESGFYVLRHCMGYLQQADGWDAAINVFRKKHGPKSAGVRATLHEEVRRDTIKGFRSTILEPEHRFFLALLMNAPTRADLLALVAQRYPKQSPVEIVLRWAEELMEATDECVTILDAGFPESLGIERDSQPELFLSAFGHFLGGDKMTAAALRDLRPAGVKALRTAFGESVLSLLVV